MIAKLAYLTTPAPGRYMLNIQPFGSDDLLRFEIAQAHLANILIDGTALALRASAKLDSGEEVTQLAVNQRTAGSNPACPATNEYHRVPAASQTESASHDSPGRQPA